MTPSIRALVRDVFFGTASRAVKLRATNELVRELKQNRYASFPFLSPDTFRSLCDVVVEGGQVKYRQRIANRNIVFFELIDIEGNEKTFNQSAHLLQLETVLKSCAIPPVVIMSHGDLLPRPELLEQVAELAQVVFSVNLPFETPKIIGIPLGLENFYLNRNGRLGDFLNQLEDPPIDVRSIEVFAAFEAENNRRTREPLIELLKSSRFGWDSRRLNPKEYRQSVEKSMFVLAPSGRGLDTHRTWEAVYLGAVPVVLRGSLASTVVEEQPILEVDRYSDFLQLSSSEMEDLFLTLRSKAGERAYMPYWVTRVLREANGV